MRILFFLRNLQTGGAERQFLQIMEGLQARGHEVLFATRTPGGGLSHLLPESIPRHVLFQEAGTRLGKALEPARTPGKLRKLVRELRPDLVYTALYVNNALAHRALQGTDTPLVWGLRNARQPLSKLRAKAFDYNRKHAADPVLAISNCHTGVEFHLESGFHFRDVRVVPNGIDGEVFRPAPEEGATFRETYDLPSDAFVIGCVGRLHEMKDHRTFLQAAELFHREAPSARFVCVGSGDAQSTFELERLTAELGLTKVVTWAGAHRDMRSAYNAFDLVASSSVAEGFPNALTEAQACGRPCVATDVGDCAVVLGEEGLLVSPGDPRAQAEAWSQMHGLSTEERESLGAKARARMLSDFSLERCAERTEAALSEIAAPRNQPS